jgi:hypothetical protein
MIQTPVHFSRPCVNPRSGVRRQAPSSSPSTGSGRSRPTPTGSRRVVRRSGSRIRPARVRRPARVFGRGVRARRHRAARFGQQLACASRTARAKLRGGASGCPSWRPSSDVAPWWCRSGCDPVPAGSASGSSLAPRPASPPADSGLSRTGAACSPFVTALGWPAVSSRGCGVAPRAEETRTAGGHTPVCGSAIGANCAASPSFLTSPGILVPCPR